jgi:hypothetical protein
VAVYLDNASMAHCSRTAPELLRKRCLFLTVSSFYESATASGHRYRSTIGKNTKSAFNYCWKLLPTTRFSCSIPDAADLEFCAPHQGTRQTRSLASIRRFYPQKLRRMAGP